MMGKKSSTAMTFSDRARYRFFRDGACSLLLYVACGLMAGMVWGAGPGLAVFLVAWAAMVYHRVQLSRWVLDDARTLDSMVEAAAMDERRVLPESRKLDLALAWMSEAVCRAGAGRKVCGILRRSAVANSVDHDEILIAMDKLAIMSKNTSR